MERPSVGSVVWRRALLVLRTAGELLVLGLLLVYLGMQLLAVAAIAAGLLAAVLVALAGLVLGVFGQRIVDPGAALRAVDVGVLVCFGGYRLARRWRRGQLVPTAMREYATEVRASWRRAAVPPTAPTPAPRTLGGSRRPTRSLRPALTSPPSILTPVIRTSPLRGHRAWKIVFAGDGSWWPALGSVTMDTIWATAVETATCGNHRDPAPEPACTCGIYALKPNVPIPPYARKDWWAEGEVELTGLVVEAQLGYRAAEARIVGPLVLHAPPGAARNPVAVAARLELHYGITVHWKGEAR